MYEFADVVRAWGPKKRRELEAWLGVKVRSVFICPCGWWVSCVVWSSRHIRTHACLNMSHTHVCLYLQPNLALEAERAAVSRMTYDEEMEHWEKVVLVEAEKEEKGMEKGKGR